MSELIQWPRAQYWDKCWNPFIGCKPCSPACEHCYAAAWAKRFGQSFEPHNTKQRPPCSGVVFCGNMTDLFGEWVPCEVSAYYITTVATNAHKATYLWLTKRVERMVEAVRDGWPQSGLKVSDFNLKTQYFGFTAENQEWYDKRFETWRADAPFGVNGWLSAEPLLGPIDLHLGYIAPEDLPFKWVATGCESGPNRRPCKIEWIESIVDQCRAREIPVFVKQLDINGKCERDITKFPKHLQIRQVPRAKEGEAK